FFGENKGLVIAEIELATENQPFDKPDWIGREVSDDPRYFNACLAQTPFSRW
ncbi:MAG: adenylate cyclase, partial [Desulfobulbus sp.]